MELQEHARPSLFEPLEDVQLPQGLRSVQRAREDAAHRSLQLETATRGRHGRTTEMEIQVEPIVVHPHRAAEVAGNGKDALSESWCEMDPGLDDPLHVVVRERAVLARGEDR